MCLCFDQLCPFSTHSYANVLKYIHIEVIKPVNQHFTIDQVRLTRVNLKVHYTVNYSASIIHPQLNIHGT